MKAATISDYIAAVEITETDKPVLRDDSVLIKVDAAYAQLAKGHAVGKIVVEAGN